MTWYLPACFVTAVFAAAVLAFIITDGSKEHLILLLPVLVFLPWSIALINRYRDAAKAVARRL